MELDINPNKFDFLCKYITGSRLYGTATDKSDTDIFGIYIDKLTNIGSHTTLIEHDDKTKAIDEKFIELRNYIESINHGDFYKMESLFLNSIKFLFLDKRWDLVKQYRESLLSSKAILAWGNEYCEREMKWANSPIRFDTGIINKIADRFKRYGFDYSCFGHSLMASQKIIWFFNEDIYYENLENRDKEFSNLIIRLKTSPEDFTLNYLNKLTRDKIQEMNSSFTKRNKNYLPNNSVVKLLQSLY